MERGYFDILKRRLAEVEICQVPEPGSRRAAVVIPLLDRPIPSAIGILRTERGIHGGQFGFPGGAIEVTDSGPLEAALREAREEIGLETGFEVLGRLGRFNTQVSRFSVDVFLVRVEPSPRWLREEAEVAAILEIPLEGLLNIHGQLPQAENVSELPEGVGYELDPTPFLIDGEIPERGAGHRLETAQGPREMPFIWGLSSRILYDFFRLAWIPSLADAE